MVADALKTVAPNYYARRQTDTARQTNTIPYRADYFGHKLHVDQNEKLEMYGVVTLWRLMDTPLYYVWGSNAKEKQKSDICCSL